MFLDLQKIRGFIFDCDGVLIDSRQANVAYYNLILQALDLPPISEREAEYVHSHTVFESIRHCVPAHRLQEALKAARRVSYRQVLPFIHLQPGLMQLLERLRASSFRIAINTNRTNTMHLVLERFGLEPFFFPVVTASRVTWPKPHPESLHMIMDMWGLSPADTVFIGDTKVDEHTAQSAGVRFWAFGSPLLEAEIHLSDYWSLLGSLPAGDNGGPAVRA